MKSFSEEVKLIAVIGMHRSGTSLVARSLQCLGYDLGNRLISLAADNPKGYWEDADILDLDIEMLKFLQRDWDSILPVREIEIEKLCSQGYLEKGARLLQEKQQNFAKYAFKDPRMVKLLPFWNKVFSSLPVKPFFLHVVRNPINVFQSLQKRNGMDLIQSLLLWLEHTITGLRYADLECSALINYDELVDFPRKSLEKIATVLNLSIDNDEFKTFEADILDQNLRHNIEIWKHSSSNILFPLVEEVYSVLANCSSDRLKDLAKTCEEWEEKFQNLFKKNTVQRILNDQQYHQFKIDQLDSKIQNLNREIQNLKVSFSEKDRELASIYQSRSWRATKPLRFVAGKFRGAFRSPKKIFVHSFSSIVDPFFRFIYRRPVTRVIAGKIQTGKFKKICLMSHFDVHDIVDPHVIYYLSKLQIQKIEVIFISSCPTLKEFEIEKIKPYCSTIILKKNFGFDFSCWQEALKHVKNILTYDSLILANDSVYGPLCDLGILFSEMEEEKYDLMGALESWERTRHLQSFFLVFNKKIIHDSCFKNFFLKHIKLSRSKENIIFTTELRLANYFRERGFHVGAYVSIPTLQNKLQKFKYELVYNDYTPDFISAQNPSLFFSDFLIKRLNFPFLKVSLFRDKLMAPKVDREWLLQVLLNKKYDRALIDNHLKRIAGTL